MTYTYSDHLFSDLHKDAYGVRPGETAFRHWNSLTPDQKQAEWEVMVLTMREAEDWRRAQEAEAIEKFEATVAKTIANGAGNRETAIRWMMDSTVYYGDWDMFCYDNGLPYGYFKKEAA